MILLGRMSPAGQGYPEPFLPPRGYDSLHPGFTDPHAELHKTRTLLRNTLGLPAPSRRAPDLRMRCPDAGGPKQEDVMSQGCILKYAI